MSKKVLWLALVAALGGFLFGFDTIVINGAEQAIQKLWGLGAGMHGIVISAALWGTVLGALIGGFFTERYGRRNTLFCVGILYFVSAVWSGLAPGPYALMAARFLGGLGVGVSTIAAPLYISEISPPQSRGKLTALFQFNIVFGVSVAVVSNQLLAHLGEGAWRWMLGVAAFPSLLFTALCLTLTESPRWLIVRQGDFEGGLAVFRALNPAMSEAEVRQLAGDVERSRWEDGQRASPFFTRHLWRPIMLAFLVAFFNQLSGVNAIWYFAKRIFMMAGLSDAAALEKVSWLGFVNFWATFAGLWLIDRIGRKTLLLIGGIGYVAALTVCSWSFYTGQAGLAPMCIFAFMIAHAVGQGTVIWVFISEIFPNLHRAAGQTLGSSTHWIFAALLTLVFPKMAEALQPGTIFAFFGGMMVLHLLWVIFLVPETKGKRLEDIKL